MNTQLIYWLIMLLINLIVSKGMIVHKILLDKNIIKYPISYILKKDSSSLSTKNKDTFLFSERYSAKLSFNAGHILLIINIMIQLPAIWEMFELLEYINLTFFLIQLITLIIIAINTEKALKKTFTKDGVCRNTCEKNDIKDNI